MTPLPPIHKLVVLAAAILFPLLASAAPVRCPPPRTAMEMEKGTYSPQEGVEFHLQQFSAFMDARSKKAPLCFARMTIINQGQVFITSESLGRMFARKIREGKSSISDVKIEMKDNAVRISGKMKKVIPLPFDIEGPVTTDGNVLRLEAKSIKAAKLPVKGLLNMVGAHLASVIGAETAAGVTAKEDVLTFEPEKLAFIKGRIASLQVKPQGLLVVFQPQKPAK